MPEWELRRSLEVRWRWCRCGFALAETSVSCACFKEDKVTYLSNQLNIFAEPSWEALSSILGIRKVLVAASVKNELEVLEEQC